VKVNLLLIRGEDRLWKDKRGRPGGPREKKSSPKPEGEDVEKFASPKMSKEEKEEIMFTLLVTITVLAVLYGLGWHNQPAKEREDTQRADDN
jgi:hypothetical protein